MSSDVSQGIGILGAIGFDFGPPPVSREALRCLANALLLRPSTRQLLVNLNYGRKAAVKLQVEAFFLCSSAISNTQQTERNDDEFICSRIVFLLTYETDLDFEELVLKYNLAEAINKVNLSNTTIYRSYSLKNQERHTAC